MNDLIHALGIDWYALLAQAINFFILMFVLGRFVYKPVLKVLDDRKKLVADSMEKVKEIERHKELVDKERVEILHKADVQAGELLNRAKTEAEAIRVEIEKTARAHADQMIAKGLQQIETERAQVAHQVQDKLARAIVLSAEKILRREFSKEDQQQFETELKENLPNLLS